MGMTGAMEVSVAWGVVPRSRIHIQSVGLSP